MNQKTILNTLYLVRHGETNFNLQGIVQGSGIDADLNDTGRAQAEALYATYGQIAFDRVFCSELKRTHQTMRPWKRAGYELALTPALNELSWGVMEGQKPNKEERDAFGVVLEEWASGNFDARVEEGESANDAWNRTKDFFFQFDRPEASGTYLCCTHGRHLRVIVAGLIDRDLTQMEKYRFANTSLTIIHFFADGSRELAQVNDLAHLDLVS